MKSVPKALALWFALLTIAALAAGQTPVRPGFNLFTPEQDVELGRQSAAQIDRQVPLVHDAEIERYVASIGARLAAGAPGPKFPYQFHVTNLSEVNAFALPGGIMYVNRGLIELVPTEGQLAGVMAHEMAHVALRHQTNQVSKAYVARAGVGILGSVLGGGSASGSAIIQAMGGVGLNALFLKFSRTAESQADMLGAQIMRRAGYDPNEMADMFELLRRQSGHDPGRLERFLSDHPAPVDREARVRQEAARLGRGPGVRPAGDLAAVKREFRGLSAPVSMKELARGGAPSGPAGEPVAVRIEPPSPRSRTFRDRTGAFSIEYPENWRAVEASSGFGVTIVPPGGAVRAGETDSIVCGVIVSRFDPDEGTAAGRFGRRGPRPFGGRSLEDITREIVAGITEANSYLSPVAGSTRRGTVSGAPAISVVLSGRSPVTGREERVTLLTREISGGDVLYALAITPAGGGPEISDAVEHAIGSLRVAEAVARR